MKQFFICTILLVITAQTFCQQSKPAQPFTREDFLQKSKNQKSGALVLWGGGTVFILGGLLIGNRNASSLDDAETGALMIAIGVVSMVGSIPLLLASARNKRKAGSASAYLIFETNSLPLLLGNHFNSYPAACIKVNF